MALFKFNEGSRFLGFINKLLDVLLLNLIWLACCLPIVTVGAATVAAYEVCLKMVDDTEGRIAHAFFRAFRLNLAKGTVLWLLNAAAVYALYLDWQIVVKSESPSILLIAVSILSSAFVFAAFLYAYPQLARYQTTVRRVMMNSIRITYRYFLRTLLLLVLLGLEVGIFWWSLTTILVGIAIGPMIAIYTVSGVSRRIFHDIERGNERAATTSRD